MLVWGSLRLFLVLFYDFRGYLGGGSRGCWVVGCLEGEFSILRGKAKEILWVIVVSELELGFLRLVVR